VGRTFGALLTIASVALYSRLLPPSQYGILTLSLSTAALFNALFCTWVAQSVFRMYSETTDLKVLLLTGKFLFVASILISVISAMLAMILSNQLFNPILMAGIVLIASGYSVFEYRTVLITRQELPFRYLRMQLTRLAFSLILPIPVYLISQSFDFFMIALGLAYWAPLTSLLVQKSNYTFKREHIDFGLIGDLAKYGVPVALSILLIQLASSLDRYILTVYSGLDTVAGYAAGADLALFAVGIVASSLNQAFYPRLLSLYSSQKFAAEQLLYRRYLSCFFALTLPASVGIYFVSGELTHLLIGESIRSDASIALSIFAFTAFFLNAKSFVFDLRFQIAKSILLPIINAIFTIALLIGCCIILIPAYGVQGAAISSFVSLSFSCGLSLALSAKLGKSVKYPINELGKIVTATALMSLVLYILGQGLGSIIGLISKILIGVSVYFLALLMMRYKPAQDALKSALSSVRAILKH